MRKEFLLILISAALLPAHDLAITAPCVPSKPWSVAGDRGALFGRQNGKFEAWTWPVKLLSNFSIRAELAGYPVPIDVNSLAAQIRVTPAETVITYSHSAFTIRQHMLAARGSTAALASVVFFEIDGIRPLAITFAFTPDMLPMWPAPAHGRPNGEWIKDAAGGFYILHTDDPSFTGLVAMPQTERGIMVPYQEHPQTFPLELKLAWDPDRDRGRIFPLITTLNRDDSAPATQVAAALKAVPEIRRATDTYYTNFFDKRLTAETPNNKLDDALRWAEVAIDQAQVHLGNETGLIAGYYESADSARPGYAWFFGRDTLWSSYAINSYGDFALTRQALDFLFKRQRADGKIMHEYSQSAAALDWSRTPYFYAAADSSPLLLMAARDYLHTSGDAEYLKAHWPALRKAYEFTRAHEGADGIYSNSEGTGWVESWPQGMPKEEIYLASLDEQSSLAAAELAALAGDNEFAAQARQKAAAIAPLIEREFYSASDRYYAFSRNTDGSLDRTASIYPAVAWWDGNFHLAQSAHMLSDWAGPEISADWGTRDISARTPFYDPISYHQGSIWPLFTGWVSLAEYRAGRSLSGYAHLMQNAELTWSQDLGSVTELLSGRFFQPLGRSSSHQLWSSAMVLSPLLRGLFGLDWDAPNRTLRLAPHLPADWDSAHLHNVPLGERRLNLSYERTGDRLVVEASGPGSESVCLVPQTASAAACNTPRHALAIALPPVEIAIPAQLPDPGAETTQLKVLEQSTEAHTARFLFAAQAGSVFDLPLRIHRPRTTAEGAQIAQDRLHLVFPSNSKGYVQQPVTFHY